jgi:hypothetical protein
MGMRVALMAMVLLAGCTSGSPPREAAGPPADAARGELLYGTACAACHTTQAHWRDKRVVRSWGDLIYQVTRWQQVAGQSWSAEEVADVAAHLNRRFYGLPCPTPGCTGPSARAEY